jgi:hypothetical protein
MLFALLVSAGVGCASTPSVSQRDAIGNPRLERLTPQELARLGPAALVKLSAEDLVRLTRQGASPDEIIDRYYRSGSRLKLDAEQIAELGRRGVDQRVLDYVVSQEREAEKIDAITAQADREAEARARAEEVYRYYRYYDPYGGWDAFSYPYYYGPRVYPYLGYGWSRGGSGWYGGVGIGF